MNKEDLYDDVDYYDIIEDKSEDNFIHETDELDPDQNEPEIEDSEDDTEIESEEESEEKFSDWDRFGLNKKYDDKVFDVNKATQFLYTFNKDETDFDEKSQIEAIRYATYFAKRKNNDAKNFVIDVIQKAQKGLLSCDGEWSVGEVAKYSFWLFFRNYVRIIIEKYYNTQNLSNADRNERIQDALQTCFEYIYKNIDKYDPEKGRINTFFNVRVLSGAVFDWEAQRKGRPSKQTMRTDKITANAIKECKEKGIIPSSALIASLTNKSYSEIQTAKARIYAENTMSTYDMPDLNNKGGVMGQSTYESPENRIIDSEKTKELIQHLDILNDQEQKFLLLNLGIVIKDNTLIEVDSLKAHEIAKIVDMSSDDVQQIINSALKKLKKEFHVKEKRGEKLLSGRGLLFNNTEDEDDKFLEDIVDIY